MEDIFTLLMLVLLQAVLGFDNLLYISLESKRAPADKQAMVRRTGIAIAIILRIVLLFVLLRLIKHVQQPWFTIGSDGAFMHGAFSGHSLIVLAGGAFIMYTATKEIWHMMGLEEIDHTDRKPRSVGRIIFWIVTMNLVFSFDSILSAMALSQVFWVMATAIVVSGVLMIWLADTVSNFLHKNRIYEVLGLFILFIVGIMLVTEGGELAHLHFFGHEVVHMSKATFYFVITVLVLTDIVQGRYQKKLAAAKEARATSS